jgi:hypothetical protein
MAKPWAEIGRYGGVGIEFVLTILIVSWLGHWLDGRVRLHGYGLAIGFLVGVAVAFRLLFRTAQRMQGDIERAEARDPGSSRWTVDPNWLHKDPSETATPSNSTHAMPPPKDDHDAG